MQIRNLVKEISQLSKAESTPEQYFAEFLPRVVSALAAIGGAIWTVDEQGRLSLQYQINLQETKLRESEAAQIQHGRLLHQVVLSGESTLVPPQSGHGADGEAGNPTDFLLVLGPIKTELETVALIEIFQRTGAGPKTQSGYLNFLNQVTALATDFFKTRQLRHFGDRQVLWTQLEEFTRVIHASLEPRACAYTIANEGRRLIECDRVSVAIRRGRKCHVEAVSGQDLFDKRSNLIRLMGRLATAVVASEEPLWYTGSTDDMAPQVEEAVQDYVDESHSKTVAVIPIFAPLRPEQESDNIEDREKRDPPLGAIIVEQIEDARVTEKLRRRVDVVCEHSRVALNNSLEHNSLFLMPLWRMIGKSRVLVKAKNLPKTLSISLAILAVLVGLCVIPWDFEMVADGTLQPVRDRDVFSRVDNAQVEEIYVKHGDDVSKGQELCRLRSSELDIAANEAKGRLASTLEQLGAVQRALSDVRNLSPGDRLRMEGQQAELLQAWHTLMEEQRLFEEKKQDLLVKAPIGGEVVTWKLEDRLRGRPVRRGEVLMQIADPTGPWEIELMMPDKRMGVIERYQEFLEDEKEAAAAGESTEASDNLRVEFTLATDPDKKFVGKVTDIHELAEVRGEDGNTVMITVAIDDEERDRIREELRTDDDSDPLRPGATVSAKIYCGKRPVGYVLLYDALAYLRRNILFRL